MARTNAAVDQRKEIIALVSRQAERSSEARKHWAS
jgi:hypothetical protein